ncbi:MAG TPA: sigma-70 family RNA polymerase sigma factor [Bryobacteraceae bacterium]|nr:sigma-70 family RNA polymerase sigma factor [Bryobacteraceae bacterium]
MTSEETIVRARAGDAAALEELVVSLQPKIYRLALRMIWHPEDARDATQEILIRIITNLSAFRGESAFSTWTYRIAANHLLTVRKNRLEEQGYTFERFGRELGQNLSEPHSPEDTLLLEEIKVGCTLAMLQCLDRPLRLAYILGEILELDHAEASSVLAVSPAVYRKRLSRARNIVVEFMKAKCGLVEPRNSCRCSKRLHVALQLGRVDPGHLLFAQNSENSHAFRGVLVEIRRLDEGRRAAALYRSADDAVPPATFTARIRELLSGMR